jgi:hypothetical protein
VERRKMEGMNLQYIYTWKCHNESLCTDISNKKYFFSKMEGRDVNQVLSGGWYLWKGRRYKEWI